MELLELLFDMLKNEDTCLVLRILSYLNLIHFAQSSRYWDKICTASIMIVRLDHSNKFLHMNKIKTSDSLRRHSFLLVVRELLWLLCVLDSSLFQEAVINTIKHQTLLSGTTPWVKYGWVCLVWMWKDNGTQAAQWEERCMFWEVLLMH